jgi:hypothetical protein
MKSQAHRNFERLLRAVVSVSNEEAKRRMENERIEKELKKKNGIPAKRARFIVSPEAFGSSKSRKS